MAEKKGLLPFKLIEDETGVGVEKMNDSSFSNLGHRELEIAGAMPQWPLRVATGGNGLTASASFGQTIFDMCLLCQPGLDFRPGLVIDPGLE